MKDLLTRKEFLAELAVLSVGGALFVGCGGGSKEEEAATMAQKPPAGTTSRAMKDPNDPCWDESGLTDADLTMKQSLKYAEVSTEEGKRCDNCKFWQKPEAGAACGGCELIKGPIHPGGWCASWFTAVEG